MQKVKLRITEKGKLKLNLHKLSSHRKMLNKFRRPHSTMLRIPFVKRALSLDISISDFYQSMGLLV